MKANRFIKTIISMVLVLAIFVTASIPVHAENETEYLSDIRIVYGSSLKDAKSKLAKSIYKDYKLLEVNLNEGTEAYIGGVVPLGEEPHVYIAYQTTKDVNLAITDIAVMDMNGGYSEGSLKAMLEQSMDECEEYAAYYKQALAYLLEAYEAGDRLADAAYRQLNLYKDPDTNKKLGDLLLANIDTQALATILLQSNINILDNMRALIALGVSYNENGKTYLEMVEEKAAQMEADPQAFANNNWYEISLKVSGTFNVLRQMIGEYRTEKDSLDYTDEEITEKELKYIEYASIVEMLENTTYLDGKSLADFIFTYQQTSDSYLKVYPLIAAMNKGQIAMTELCQFYNILKFSTSETAAEAMEAQIAQLEKDHADGISIYLGVDREIFEGSFAVTSVAERMSASTGRNVAAEVFGSTSAIVGYIATGLGTIGNIGLLVYNLKSGAGAAAGAAPVPIVEVAAASAKSADKYMAHFSTAKVFYMVGGKTEYGTAKAAFESLVKEHNIVLDTTKPYMDQVTQFVQMHPEVLNDKGYWGIAAEHQIAMSDAKRAAADSAVVSEPAASGAASGGGISIGASVMIFSGITLALTALNIGIWLVNYYNPDLSDIPLKLVDAKDSETGDRYILYNVVESIDGKAADTNAFEGERWNALYVTKSYEAGPALTADFSVSYASNKAGEDQLAVHKFGQADCFNLNKHAFGDDLDIYLSVTKTEDKKEGDTGIPDVVGTILTAGSYFLAGGVGIIAGALIMMGVQKSRKKEVIN